MEENQFNQTDMSTEHRLTGLETKVETIMTNHLPHLQEGIDSVRKLLMWQITILISTLIGVIVTLLTR